MSLKIFFARWIASRIENRLRHRRRALRDYQRQELSAISLLARRSRGLRLYAAWSRRDLAKVVSMTATDWSSTALPHAA